MHLLIRGAQVVSPAQAIDTVMDVLVQDGQIAALGHDLPANGAEIVNAQGLMLIPGLIDLHTHLGDPGREDRETWESGAAAAARGGYTTILMMPDTEPTLDTVPAVAHAVSQGKHNAVRVLVAAALTKHLDGVEMAELQTLHDAGAVAFVQPDRSISRAGLLRRILQYGKGIVPLIVEQPVDASLVADGMMHEGLNSTIYGIKGIPAAAEEITVARDIMLAEDTGSPLHLSKISTAGSARLVSEAKAKGVTITCDVSPYHLVLTDDSLASYDPNFKLMPPLRTASDVNALCCALASGVIDCVVTDHTPLTQEEKDIEFSLAPYGATGLETTFAFLYTELVDKGILTISQLVSALSFRPAQMLGRADVAGTLQPGSPADFVLVDPNVIEQVKRDSLISQKNSPLMSMNLKGWPVATYVGGQRVFAKGDPA